jgi:hypothetical protein
VGALPADAHVAQQRPQRALLQLAIPHLDERQHDQREAAVRVVLRRQHELGAQRRRQRGAQHKEPRRR